ncbi:MAG: pyridoxamine 5'-phosphate oxidase family protein [Pseudomonadota bacterium]
MSNSLPGLLSAAWDRLSAAPTDRTAPYRTLSLATSDSEGWPDTRTVVLRAADPDAAILQIQTDSASAKCNALASDPRCALLFWDPGSQVQLRCRARATLRPGTTEEWAALAQPQTLAYGGMPPPGMPIDRPEHHTRLGNPDRLTLITCTVEQIDLVQLDPDRHRRALYTRKTNWQGQWIAP